MQNIHLENEDLLICPADRPELVNCPVLTREVFQLLSDKETLRYLPEKQLTSLEEAQSWLGTTLMNMHCGRNRTHLIFSRDSRRLLGVIDLIPPRVAREHYQLATYPFFIEFYLKKSVTGNSLMSNLLPKVIGLLQERGIMDIAAIINRRNAAASKVLQRAGFQKTQTFGPEQDLYSLSA